MADLSTFMQTYLARGREERQAAREAQARKEYIEAQTRMFDERLAFDKMQTAIANRRADESFDLQKQQMGEENKFRLLQEMGAGRLQPGSTEYTPPSPIPGLDLGGPPQKVVAPAAMQLFGQSVAPVSPEFRRHSETLDEIQKMKMSGQVALQQRMDVYKQSAAELEAAFSNNPAMKQIARQMAAMSLIGQPLPDAEERLATSFIHAMEVDDQDTIHKLLPTMTRLARLKAESRTLMFSPSASVSGDRFELEEKSNALYGEAMGGIPEDPSRTREETSRLAFVRLQQKRAELQQAGLLTPELAAAFGAAMAKAQTHDVPAPREAKKPIFPVSR